MMLDETLFPADRTPRRYRNREPATGLIILALLLAVVGLFALGVWLIVYLS
jgi:hypothetical protein